MDRAKREYYEGLYGKPNVKMGDPDGKDWELPDDIIPPAGAVQATADDAFFSRRDITLPVLHQGTTNTCVGQTAKVCMQDTDDFRTEEELSAMYIYYQAQRHDEWDGEGYEGTSISGACKAIRHKGNVLEKSWPNKVLDPPTDIAQLEKQAAGRKLKAYYYVHQQDSKFDSKIMNLLTTDSLLTSFRFSSHFYEIGPDGIVDEAKFEANLVPGAGHAVTIIGWKMIGGKLYWEIQNSWGTGWGDNGHCYFPNDLLKKYMMRGVYYMVTQKEEQGEVPFEYKKKSRKTMFIVLGAVGGGLALLWLLSKAF